VLAVTACGGSDGAPSGGGEKLVTPEAWMASFCAAGVDWLGDLEENAAALETRTADARGLDQVRRELVRYFARAAALTDETVARIERAGTPAIDDRERLVADFTGLVEDTGGLFTDAGDEVRALEIRDRAEFQARVSEIAERLEERAARVVAEFTELAKRYDTPELDRAFSKNEDCARFSGAPS
jgi:hypothetical protein